MLRFKLLGASLVAIVVTFSAGYMKIFSPDPKIGFLSGATSLVQSGSGIANAARGADFVRQAAVWRFDAFVAGVFLLLVLSIVLGSAAQWYRLITGGKRVELHESEFIPLTHAARSTA